MRELRPSPFVLPASVQAWDAWFRWRGPDGLHDRSIEDTWTRVADFLASAEPGASAGRQRALLLEALGTWQLLPDERLLAHAGTGRPLGCAAALHVALNAAAFVPTDQEPPSVMLDLLAERAALAVRCLAGATAKLGAGFGPPRIVLIGLADALALLGLRYDSAAARAQARAIAQALARGVASGNRASAALLKPTPPEQRPARPARGAGGTAPNGSLPACGPHRPALTAIVPQPRLALLANDVADAADPRQAPERAHANDRCAEPWLAAESGRTSARPTTASDGGARAPDTLATVSPQAQLAMRAALQPWIDLPISYPLPTLAEPGPHERREIERYARRCGLRGPIRFRPAGPAGLDDCANR